MRMRYEVDHERRRMHAVLEDGFDSYLFIGFCLAIEKKERVRLIDSKQFDGENRNRYSITIDVFGSSFYADLVELAIQPGTITVCLRPVQ
jgi:hypothetical protein